VKSLRLSISVVNSNQQLVEPVQDISYPVCIQGGVVVWGFAWYMQTPLENLISGTEVVVKLLRGPSILTPSSDEAQAEDRIHQASFPVDKQAAVSGCHSLVLIHNDDENDDISLHFDIALSTRSLHFVLH
jgi:hypothetical protein